MDYKKISQDVVDHVGGISNIKGATHCVTRLRLILNDETKYDRKALENIEGVKGVLFNSGQLMIIFGTGTVNNVYDAFIELTGVKEMSQSDAKAEGMSKMGKLQQGFKVFSDIFIPIIPAFVAAAILTGVKALLTANGLFGLEGSLADQSKLVADIAEFLAIMATTFNYLPILVMYSAVKRFGGNPILGILVGIVMVHPDRTADQEDRGDRQNGVQLGECSQNQRLTHYVVAVADRGDTVGANLRLEVGRREADHTRQQSGAENGGTLQHRDLVRQEILDDEVVHESVETLRTGDGGQNHVAAERTGVLLHRADGRHAGDRGADTACHTRKTDHQRYADVGHNNCCCHN